MAKVKIDMTKVNRAVQTSFDRTVDRMSQAFDDAISDKLYEWPRETKRRNGEIAGSPRNIIDTGALLESKTITRSSSSDAAEFSWSASHAAEVHHGVTFRSGFERPARPWTEKALEETNPADVFARQLGRLL